MGDGNRRIAEEACRLARLLPCSVIEAVAIRLERGVGQSPGSLKALESSGPSRSSPTCPRGRLPRPVVDGSPGVLPGSVAVALLTASEAEKHHREGQSIELVWTGPEVGVVPLRRTEQVVLQVIDSASQRLLVVSYAVFNIPRICEALIPRRRPGGCHHDRRREPRPDRRAEGVQHPGGPWADRGKPLWRVRLAHRGTIPDRLGEAGAAPRQMRRGRRQAALPLLGKPHRVCVLDQHGARRPDHRRAVVRRGGGPFREDDRIRAAGEGVRPIGIAA